MYCNFQQAHSDKYIQRLKKKRESEKHNEATIHYLSLSEKERYRWMNSYMPYINYIDIHTN